MGWKLAYQTIQLIDGGEVGLAVEMWYVKDNRTELKKRCQKKLLQLINDKKWDKKVDWKW